MYDDEGIDLVFSLRGRPVTLAVQVKSRFSTSRRVKSGSFRMDIKRSTFQPRPDLAIVGVMYNDTSGGVDAVWVIPSLTFAKLVEKQSGGISSVWVMRTSLAPAASDVWTEYREIWGALPAKICDLLKEL